MSNTSVECDPSANKNLEEDSKDTDNGDTAEHETGNPVVSAENNPNTRLGEQSSATDGSCQNNSPESHVASGPGEGNDASVVLQTSEDDLPSRREEESHPNSDGPSDDGPQSLVEASHDDQTAAETNCDETESSAQPAKPAQPAASLPQNTPGGEVSEASAGEDLSSPDVREKVQCAESSTSAGKRERKDSSEGQSVYHIKWVRFCGGKHAIVTQNENGPCPLIAIINVLLLQGKVKLPPQVEMVTSQQLMECLADYIFENAPKAVSSDEGSQLNFEQNMHDAIAVFHKLQTGLDVNVRFTGVRDFEYTSECIVFDLLGIRLYHGWLVDPQNAQEVAAVGSCSYNQLVEKIISQKTAPQADKVTEALVCEDFLTRTSHQLTYHGLSELVATVTDSELSVLFRNNHFSTLHKHKGELFVLVTDQGFLTEPGVVWETLANVEGDGHFVDAAFLTFRRPPTPDNSPVTMETGVEVGSEQQIDADYLVALSLQEEASPLPSATAVTTETDASALTDLQLAMRLQEEENQRAAALPRQPAAASPRQPAGASPRQPTATTGGRERSKSNSDCVIL